MNHWAVYLVHCNYEYTLYSLPITIEHTSKTIQTASKLLGKICQLLHTYRYIIMYLACHWLLMYNYVLCSCDLVIAKSHQEFAKDFAITKSNVGNQKREAKVAVMDHMV